MYKAGANCFSDEVEGNIGVGGVEFFFLNCTFIHVINRVKKYVN